MSDDEVFIDHLPDQASEIEDPVIVEREELHQLAARAEMAEQLETLSEMLDD